MCCGSPHAAASLAQLSILGAWFLLPSGPNGQVDWDMGQGTDQWKMQIQFVLLESTRGRDHNTVIQWGLSIVSHPCLVEGSRVCDLCCSILVPRADDWQMTGAIISASEQDSKGMVWVTLQNRCQGHSLSVGLDGMEPELVLNHTCSNKPRLLVL